MTSKSVFISILILFSVITNSQTPYPQDYFGSPLKIPILLSGTFGELRSNHFHSGLDIKTQGKTGIPVYATANGYVSRIKIAHFGYGNALYITHPNGYTTVYAHLQRFSKTIEAYIKKAQYKKESFEIELFPDANQLLITKNTIVAYTGNTGSSGGPHLHYEIRDNQERPINPLLFGIDVKDSKKPTIKNMYVYPKGQLAHVNKLSDKQKIRLTPLKNGYYKAEGITAYGQLGFAIQTTDKQDLTANNNGVYNIQTIFNGTPIFNLNFKRFAFSETKHLNRLIDYKHYITKKQRQQKLFIDSNNPLSLYNETLNNGFIHIEDSTDNIYTVLVKDFKGNTSKINVEIKGKFEANPNCNTHELVTPNYIYADAPLNLNEGHVSVNFPKQSFYDNFFMTFKVNNDTVTLHNNTVPLKKYFSIKYDISQYNSKHQQQLYIAKLSSGKKTYSSYISTKKKGDTLYGKSKYLGTYILASDSIKPNITSANFKNKQWLSKYRYLKLKIKDNESGIAKYRATVNGKWILMAYDYKTNTLTHDFNDGIITDTKNNFKLIVIDNVGNSSIFERQFYRK